jgi:hypothetical protein
MHRPRLFSLIGLLLLALAPAAMAHPGHGLDSTTHWHATDALGFLLMVLVLIGALAWWRNRP